MDKEQKIKTVTFYKDYFIEFFVKQREKVQDKITWTLEILEHLEKIPETYLKHLENTDGLYEIAIINKFAKANTDKKSDTIYDRLKITFTYMKLE